MFKSEKKKIPFIIMLITTFISLIVFIVILTAIFLYIKRRNNGIGYANPRIEQVEMSFAGPMAFTNRGIIYFGNNNLINFTDINSGLNVVLCDKPNCEHLPASSTNPDPTCNAVIEGGASIITIYSDKIYFIGWVKNERISTHGLYVLDLNGSNRKCVAIIENALSIYNPKITNNKLIFVYKNSQDTETLEMKEKDTVGIVCIDLTTYKVIYLHEKEGYGADISKFYYSSNDEKIIYEFSYAEEDVLKDFTKENGYNVIPPDSLVQLAISLRASEIYSYDLNGSEETFMYKRESDYAFLVTGEKAYYDLGKWPSPKRGHYEYDFATGVTAEFPYGIGDIYASIRDGSNLLISTWIRNDEPLDYFYSLGLESNELKKLGSLPYQAMFAAATMDYIYLGAKYEGTDWYYVMEKDDFYKGDMSSIRPLMPYNPY